MPASIVTYGMIGLNTLVYLVMSLKGVSPFSPTAEQVLPWGADFGPLTTSGQAWRLLTACFIHFGFLHIAMNMYCLLQAGILTERLFGRARFLLIYLLAGIGGNILGLYIHPLTVSAGASGAVFGVYGALLAFLLVRRGVVANQAALAVARSAGFFILFNFVYGLSSSTTDMTAHIGGLLVGFLAGCLMAWSLAPLPQAQRTVRALGAAVILAVVTYASFARVPKSSPSLAAWYSQTLTGSSVTIGSKDTVDYTSRSNPQQAHALGDALQSIGFFQDKGLAVLLDQGARGPEVSISIKDSAWDDPRTIQTFQAIGRDIAPALGSQPLTLHLIDVARQATKDLPIQ
jgi:rhomboid protease GluP